MDQEKVHSAHVWEAGRGFHDNFLSRCHLLLLSSDLNRTTLASSPFLVFDGPLKGLVSCSYNFVEGKIHCSHKVMVRKVVQVVEVVNVIYFYLIVVSLFEVVLNVETFDPYGIQVVHNDLSHAYLRPRVACLSVEYHHAVSARKSVEVGQVLCCERE